MRWRVIVAVLVVLVVGCGTDEVGGSTEQQGGDASARLACSHFRNIAGDAAAGILTDSEVRGKLKEVHEDAYVSEVDGVRNAAREMLRAATQGDEQALADAVNAMGTACGGIGH